jgi:gluconokinase
VPVRGDAGGERANAFILMGVAGSGKSTVGAHVAARLCWPFVDGDHFRPPECIAKMAMGAVLADADHVPWIDSLAYAINARRSPAVIVACSALTRFARQRLCDCVQRPVHFLHLRASPEVVAMRLRDRPQFMRAGILTVQLAVFEPPREAIEIDADDTIDVVAAQVIAGIRKLLSDSGVRC